MNSGVKSLEQHPLPERCRFTMQQWLYRRTSHTRRYKRCYMVLHNDRLYSFRKPPNYRKCDSENLSMVLRYATASWMIAGAELKADTQGARGFYEWKIIVKSPKRYLGDENGVFTTARGKLAFYRYIPGEYKTINDIFRDIDAGNRVTNSGMKPYTDDRTVCLATNNYKVASDWLQAVLCTVRYGSLRNFVAQNALRTKYLAFRLPLYLLYLEYFPKSQNVETAPRRKAAFTFMKLRVLELLHIPLPEETSISCIVEYNSSFYVLNLPTISHGTHVDIPKVVSNVSAMDDEHHTPDGGSQPSKDRLASLVSDTCNNPVVNAALNKESIKRPSVQVSKHDISGVTEVNEDDRVKQKSNANTSAPQGYNVLSKLWGLNKGSEKRKVVISKRSHLYCDDACVYIPIYQNCSQDFVWVHVVTTNDIYIGSAALSNCDFAITEPAKPKTCILKHIETINPLNPKRLNISDCSNPCSVVQTSNVSAKVPESGYIVLSVVTPKHYGNFMDPVTLSHNSPQEYLVNATKASTSGGLHTLDV